MRECTFSVFGILLVFLCEGWSSQKTSSFAFRKFIKRKTLIVITYSRSISLKLHIWGHRNLSPVQNISPSYLRKSGKCRCHGLQDTVAWVDCKKYNFSALCTVFDMFTFIAFLPTLSSAEKFSLDIKLRDQEIAGNAKPPQIVLDMLPCFIG